MSEFGPHGPEVTDIPDISQYGSEQLLILREAIDERLSALRAEFIEKASKLGLSVVEGNRKKRKRLAHKEKE